MAASLRPCGVRDQPEPADQYPAGGRSWPLADVAHGFRRAAIVRINDAERGGYDVQHECGL